MKDSEINIELSKAVGYDIFKSKTKGYFRRMFLGGKILVSSKDINKVAINYTGSWKDCKEAFMAALDNDTFLLNYNLGKIIGRPSTSLGNIFSNVVTAECRQVALASLLTLKGERYGDQ